MSDRDMKLQLIIDAVDRTSKAWNSLKGRLGTLRSNLLNIKTLALAAFSGWGLTRLGRDFLDTASGLERLRFMMDGVEKSINKGRAAFDFVMDFAQRAPVRINALADAYVKLRVSGLDPSAGALQTLVDAVAHFGGTSENLTRASVAIQQMAGKGVISMEELRQQLGEHVPGAIQIMAREMGMSMRELVDMVSKGNLDAKTGLEALFRGMEKDFGGSSERVMAGWIGLTTRMTVQWKMFQKGVMDQGIFDYMKAGLDLVLQKIEKMKQDGTWEKWTEGLANSFINMVEKITLGAAGLVDATSGMIKAIWADLKIMWEGFKKLPDWVKEIGIIGALIGGARGKLVILGLLRLVESGKNIYEGFNQVMAGNISMTELAGMNAEELAAKLQDLRDKGIIPAADAIDQANNTSLAGLVGGSNDATNAVQGVIDKLRALAAQNAANRAAAEKDDPLAGHAGGEPPPESSTAKTAAEIKKIKDAWDDVTLAALPEHARAIEEVKRKYAELRDKLTDVAFANNMELEDYDRLWQQLGERQGEELTKLAQEADEKFQLVKTFSETTAGSLESSFTDAFMTVEDGFKSLGDIAKGTLRAIVAEFYKLAVARPVAQGVGGWLGSVVGKMFGAKDGAILEGSFQPIPRFASGATRIDKATLGWIGEGRLPEAVVPLPDGRSIPVQFQGQGGGGTNVHLTNSFQLSAADGKSMLQAILPLKEVIIGWTLEALGAKGLRVG